MSDTEPAPAVFGWDSEDVAEVKHHAQRVARAAHYVWESKDARVADITDRLKSAHIDLLDLARRLDRLATERAVNAPRIADRIVAESLKAGGGR